MREGFLDVGPVRLCYEVVGGAEDVWDEVLDGIERTVRRAGQVA